VEVLPHARKLFCNPEASLARGAVVATIQAASVSDVSQISGSDISMLLPESVVVAPGERMRVTTENPIPTWSVGKFKYTLTPVFVHKKPKNTVGLGDNISAAALAFCLNPKA